MKRYEIETRVYPPEYEFDETITPTDIKFTIFQEDMASAKREATAKVFDMGFTIFHSFVVTEYQK